ncbi:uncharacterized protein BCR38DRAFT_413035 [Pseudomassariella vexata]|uniref:Uncharacterized protein n=1 Tax=Pseudomassariella vexata TaxID=1141098 RepID=A0A1Y2DIR1_9PEZI|nr:uncharacterized protein BCR38DRAFT_413035 [Pseudomassariella vexata]ORY58715.1 hypothetical protein BCR38DRAFT_413035 [Pseudomassariella vexata]
MYANFHVKQKTTSILRQHRVILRLGSVLIDVDGDPITYLLVRLCIRVKNVDRNAVPSRVMEILSLIRIHNKLIEKYRAGVLQLLVHSGKVPEILPLRTRVNVQNRTPYSAPDVSLILDFSSNRDCRCFLDSISLNRIYAFLRPDNVGSRLPALGSRTLRSFHTIRDSAGGICVDTKRSAMVAIEHNVIFVTVAVESKSVKAQPVMVAHAGVTDDVPSVLFTVSDTET